MWKLLCFVLVLFSQLVLAEGSIPKGNDYNAFKMFSQTYGEEFVKNIQYKPFEQGDIIYDASYTFLPEKKGQAHIRVLDGKIMFYMDSDKCKKVDNTLQHSTAIINDIPVSIAGVCMLKDETHVFGFTVKSNEGKQYILNESKNSFIFIKTNYGFVPYHVKGLKKAWDKYGKPAL